MVTLTQAPTTSLCVLVIDDDPTQLDLLADLLESEGFTVERAPDAAAAEERLRAGGVGVAVVDLRLPDAEGTELIRRLRAMDPSVRAIINTGYASLETAKSAITLGVFAYIEKAGDPNELIVQTHRAMQDRMSEALDTVERRLRSIVTHAPDVIAELDEAGVLLWTNSTIAGLSPERATGRRLRELVPAESAASIERSLADAVAAGEPREWECAGIGDGKADSWAACRVAPIAGSPGRPARVVLIARDITDRRRHELMLRQREEQLRQSQKMEAVGQLASGIAHDFNNLLMAIQGYLELARHTLPPGHPAGEALSRVEEAAEQAGGITSSLLTFTRKTAVAMRPVEFSPVIERTATLLGRTVPASIEVRVDTAATAGLWVLADETQLQQVLMNLAINARDAMPTGGRLVITTAADAAGHALVRVADTGAGIPEELRDRVFEPYFTTKAREQGTGLGLSIVHAIVASHGGSISLESPAGEGAVFVVRLPTTDTRPAPREREPRAAAPAVAGRHAMLVEDNAHVRGLVASMLATLGYRVTQASSAEQALTALAVPGARFELLVMDIDLPGMPGTEGARAAREAAAELPILLITGSVDRGSEGPLPPGARLLRKPFMLSDLDDAVDAVLHPRDGAAEGAR